MAKNSAKYIVTQRFMDSDQYVVDGKKQTYEVDSDVSHLDEDRLKQLVKAKLVKESNTSEK